MFTNYFFNFRLQHSESSLDVSSAAAAAAALGGGAAGNNMEKFSTASQTDLSGEASRHFV